MPHVQTPNQTLDLLNQEDGKKDIFLRFGDSPKEKIENHLNSKPGSLSYLPVDNLSQPNAANGRTKPPKPPFQRSKSNVPLQPCTPTNTTPNLKKPRRFSPSFPTTRPDLIDLIRPSFDHRVEVRPQQVTQQRSGQHVHRA